MKIRTEIKLPPRERKQIEAVAKELQWTITEVIRHCVRASLEWLLDKETNKKLQDLCTDLKQDDDRKNNKPIVENSQQEEISDEELFKLYEEIGMPLTKEDGITDDMIKIANTKWLNDK